MNRYDWIDDVLRDVIAYAVLHNMQHVARHVALGLDALHLHIYDEERGLLRAAPPDRASQHRRPATQADRNHVVRIACGHADRGAVDELDGMPPTGQQAETDDGFPGNSFAGPPSSQPN